MFGSRWGAALSTGAAQMPPKRSKHQLSRDTGTRWSLLIQSHPQPSHLLSHSLAVITHGTGWAHDGCWENKDRNLDMIFPLRFNGNKLSEILFYLFIYFHRNLNDVLNGEVRSGPAVLLRGEFSRCSVFQSHNGE